LGFYLYWFVFEPPTKSQSAFSFSTGNPEFPALASIVFCFGFAALSAFLGLSVAHGAFLSGSNCHSRERNVILQMMTPCEYVFFSFASAFSWT
jgi:Kef-type K+ transport system membrane component KefB